MNSKRPTILIDVDGVLADFIGGALRVVYDVTGLQYAPSDVTEFDFCKSLGLSREDGSAVKREIGKRAGFCRDLFPFPGAREGVAALSSLADVYIVTSPWNSNATWMSEREAWLEHYFDVPHSRVIHASAKHLVWGDMFVDDKTEAVAAWERAWPAGIAVQWQTPHNRGDAWTGHSTSDWSRIIDIARWLAACDTPSAPGNDGEFVSGAASSVDHSIGVTPVALPVAARDTGALSTPLRCECSHEQGDSRCEVHPTCDGCGLSGVSRCVSCAELLSPPNPDSPSVSAGVATAANVARTSQDETCRRWLGMSSACRWGTIGCIVNHSTPSRASSQRRGEP